MRRSPVENSAWNELTRSKLRSYTPSVNCRIISAAFLGVWIVLLAGDFCEDVGLFDDDNSAVDLAVDIALADLGQAIDASTDHSGPAAWVASRDHSPISTAAMHPAAFFAAKIFYVSVLDASRALEVTNAGQRSVVLLL